MTKNLMQLRAEGGHYLKLASATKHSVPRAKAAFVFCATILLLDDPNPPV
jgi:hypothetical protein